MEILPKTHDGLIKDLKPKIVTMSPARGYQCPNKSYHPLIESNQRVYCYMCGIYWRKK